MIVSSVILASNSNFGGKILLENLAYDMALTVRQAQVYGISTQRFGANNYSAGYGLHFAMSSPALYVLFADAVTANGLYDSGELVQSIAIERGYTIQKLCATPINGSEDCTLTQLDILFKRPEPDAWISANGTSCILLSGSCQESARIFVNSPRGDVYSILVDVNGQVSVQ